MTEEEDKAIKDCDSIFICLDDAMSEDSANDYRKSYKILKNLIEKQSKEIEELKDEYNTKLLSNAGIYQLGFKDGKNSVKNKIKAKIEELKKQWIVEFETINTVEVAMHNGIIQNKLEVLQSLLEKE